MGVATAVFHLVFGRRGGRTSAPAQARAQTPTPQPTAVQAPAAAPPTPTPPPASSAPSAAPAPTPAPVTDAAAAPLSAPAAAAPTPTPVTDAPPPAAPPSTSTDVAPATDAEPPAAPPPTATDAAPPADATTAPAASGTPAAPASDAGQAPATDAPPATESAPPSSDAAPPVASEAPPAAIETPRADVGAAASAAAVFLSSLRARDRARLSRPDYERAATALGLTEWEGIAAVARTEAERGAYGPDGRPTILFERHWFHEFTGGVHGQAHPDISSTRPGGYGDGSHANAWARFERAFALDPEAAIKATSWGQFQMMGFNFHMTPHATPQALVAFMAESEANQLSVFMDYVRFNNLTDALRDHQWRTFAAGYNGPAYERNNYHGKMERFYGELRASAGSPAASGYVVPAQWRLAKSLAKLRAQIDAKYPDRDKGSDGDIGDEAHAARGSRSDHNAYIMDGDMPVVTAIDITNDADHCAARAIVDALVASRDSRIKYIIFDRQICSSVVSPWTWRPYTGDNPHQRHFHISVDANKDKYDDEGRDWQV